MYPCVAYVGLLLRERHHCVRYTFGKLPWKLACHVCSNSPICFVPNSVALSSVFDVNFINEIFKSSHFGFTNGP